MAEVTIRLRCDPATGKRTIIVGLRPDADALPHEHEQQHKALVERLLGLGLLRPEDAGEVIVERESGPKRADETGTPEPALVPPTGQRQAGQAGG